MGLFFKTLGRFSSGIFGSIAGFFGGFWLRAILLIAFLVGLMSFGGYMGYQYRSIEANKEALDVAKQTLVEQQHYIDAIRALQDTQKVLQEELNAALMQNQEVVTKYVTRVVVKEIHDHPTEYACPVPESGWTILRNQATELNNIRTRQ